MEQLTHRLDSGEVIVIDGGMGTEIEARGAVMDDAAWCALANVDRPELVQAIHEDFIRAGADVIIANTFPAGRPTLQAAGHGDRWEEINRAGVDAAKRARDAVGRPVVIAGAVGGLPTATDTTFHERGLSPVELREAFSAQALVLADAGVDLIALEMVGPGTYAGPAVEGAKAAGLPVWLGVSVLTLLEDGETDYGTLENPADRQAMDEIVAALATPEIAAVTVMHSNLDQVLPALELIRSHWDGPVGAYPHFGKFNAPNWEFHDIAPETFLAEARQWVEHGAQLIGGCCGIRPPHIAALRDGLPASVTA